MVEALKAQGKIEEKQKHMGIVSSSFPQRRIIRQGSRSAGGMRTKSHSARYHHRNRTAVRRFKVLSGRRTPPLLSLPVELPMNNGASVAYPNGEVTGLREVLGNKTYMERSGVMHLLSFTNNSYIFPSSILLGSHPISTPSCQEDHQTVRMGSHGRKILLVEDNEVNRVVVRRLVRGMGMGLELEEVENGRSAVEYFVRGNVCDLVLMDKDMPVMDGHEATRQLRSLGVRIPIVALSGDSLQPTIDLFFQAGADEFQTKPLSKEKLVRILARFGLTGM